MSQVLLRPYVIMHRETGEVGATVQLSRLQAESRMLIYPNLVLWDPETGEAIYSKPRA